MLDPSPDLVRLVRRRARQWAHGRGAWRCDLDDVEGDALEWLCTYDPPAGWDTDGATIKALRWYLATRWRNIARTIRRETYRTPDTLPLGPSIEPGFALVEADALLDGLSADDTRTLLCISESGAQRTVAAAQGVTEGAVTLRRRAIAARVRERVTLEDLTA